MTRTLATALATGIAAAAFAAGCGGGGGTTGSVSPAAEWADHLCTATSTWTAALRDSATALQNGPYTKDALQTATSAARSATQTYLSALGDLGRPDTQAGQDAQAQVETLRTQLQSGVDTIGNATKDVSGAGGIVEVASLLGTTLTTMGNELSTTVATLKQLDPKGELEQAISQTDSCAKLGS